MDGKRVNINLCRYGVFQCDISSFLHCCNHFCIGGLSIFGKMSKKLPEEEVNRRKYAGFHFSHSGVLPFANTFSKIGVSVTPGLITDTLIPNPSTSFRRTPESPSNPLKDEDFVTWIAMREPIREFKEEEKVEVWGREEGNGTGRGEKVTFFCFTISMHGKQQLEEVLHILQQKKSSQFLQYHSY
jgi:hypothetical protein